MSECAKCSCYQRADLSNFNDQISEPFTCSDCGEKFIMNSEQLKEFIESQEPLNPETQKLLHDLLLPVFKRMQDK